MSELIVMENYLKKNFGCKFFTKPTPAMYIIHVFLYLITFGKSSDFLSRFTTTIGSRIYYSSTPRSDISRARTLAHEGIHLIQQKRDGRILFSLKYLLSRSCRAAYEYEAYILSNAVSIWKGESLDKPTESQVNLFTGPSYLYMDTDIERVRMTLEIAIINAISGEYPYIDSLHKDTYNYILFVKKIFTEGSSGA